MLNIAGRKQMQLRIAKTSNFLEYDIKEKDIEFYIKCHNRILMP
jgi:hypothetical protein